MRTTAKIQKIYKVAPDIYSTYVGFGAELKTHSHGTGSYRLTDEEACALTVYDTIAVDAGWNEDGNGCYIKIVRPIQVVKPAQRT